MLFCFLACSSGSDEFLSTSRTPTLYDLYFPAPGDITPVNTLERTYTTIIMFGGAACFAFVISQVSNIAADLSLSSQKFRTQMDSLADFAHYRHLPDDLAFEIRRYFQREYLRQRVADEKNLLSAMTPDLRVKVLKHMYGTHLESSRLLRDIQPEQLHNVYNELQDVFARPGEVLYAEHNMPLYIYIVFKGEVDVWEPKTGHRAAKHGAVIGESGLLFERPRSGSAVCRTYCELIRVPRSAIMSTLRRHKKALRKLRRHEAIDLWVHALDLAEQQVRFWALGRKLRRKAVEYARQHGLAMEGVDERSLGVRLNALPSRGSPGASHTVLTASALAQVEPMQAQSALSREELCSQIQAKSSRVSELELQLAAMRAQLGQISALLEASLPSTPNP